MYNLLLLLSGIFISGVHCGYYFVTCPNVIRFNHAESVVVSVFGLHNAAVRVWLQYGEKIFSEQNVNVVDEVNPASTTIQVTEDDIFDETIEEKPRTIKIYSEFDGQIQTRELILSYHTGYLIIQTDKPIYTPLQKVNIRTLALDETLRAVDGWQVAMEIISPTNLTVARRTIENSPSGFFQHEFALPPYPEDGMWTARAFYKGQFETESRSLFEVREYVLPTYGLTIDVDVPFILPDTENILVTVRAKYVYGKPVKGNARLTLNLKDENGVSEYILDVVRRSLESSPDFDGSATDFSTNVSDILNSPLLRGKGFPEGCHLEVVATVYEDATGKEEAASHDRTIFATRPYTFKFTRSKSNFRPGWEYFVKVEMLYANGQLVTGETISLRMFKNGVYDSSKRVTTDMKGQAVAVFVTSQDTNTLTFKAATLDERYESESFDVSAYVGNNQIQVERVITNDNLMVMRAFTNIQGDGYTGMLFMVVTRGKIVYTTFKESSNQASEPIIEKLQQIVSPNGRLLVFYVDKGSHELVADSIKFDVEKKCRGAGLNLETTKLQVKPGTSDRLTVTGSPFMWVGLNIMDKALLLLNDKNVLRKNKMFDALESHDLGCGEGSGRNSADVFKKSGLTVLTNAVVSDDDIVRNTDECEGKRRKKRDYGSCHYYGADMNCCDRGKAYAKQVFNETDSPGSVNTYVKCYADARMNLKRGIWPIKCIMASFLTCRDELDTLISGVTNIKMRALEDESEYASELARLADARIKPTVRSDFRESWLFEVDHLDKDGVKNKILNFPHSITEWMIQAIGITPDKGMCIADEIDVKAYRDFFVQLDLPYKAVRLEHFDVKATLFNYGLPTDDNKAANIYLEGVENLCYHSEPGQASPRVQIELPPNSAKTVSFPMIPLRNGMFPVKVIAVVAEVGIPEVDMIEKGLYVVNEGVEKQVAINICLDPANQREDCRNDERVISDVQSNNERVYEIDLTLPENGIATTGEATAYIQSNVMDNVVKILVEGVESLFRAPSGCGEQAMVKVAPTVYAMSYLKETDQVTKEIEIQGNQLIRDGVNYMVSQYRHADGSYSIYRHVTTSTWLTAFVAKVFCQAKEVVDDAVDEREDLKITLDWLKDHVNDDGSFDEPRPVYRGMMGQVNEADPSLSAFVLIAIQECNMRSDGIKDTIQKAKQYLEGLPEDLLKNNPFLLAISTYALALSDSPMKHTFKAYLHEIEHRDGKDMYWGNPGGKPANAYSVETTAYALLAMIKFNDFKNSAHIVRWLTSQREASGSFRSTQDTVVGLQALKQYSLATFSTDVDLQVELIAKGWEGKMLTVTADDSIVREIVRKLPVEHDDNKLTVKVTGTGSGIMTIDLRYNRPATEEEQCPFEISDLEVEVIQDAPIDVNIGRERDCDVCGRCEEDPEQPDDYNPDMFEEEVDLIDEFEEDVDVIDEDNFGRRRRAPRRKPRRTSTKTCIRFSVSSKNEKVHGMSNVIFGLQTGVEVVREDLEKLKADNPNIEMYEMPSNGKGFIVFYLNEVTPEETKFIFRLKDNFEGDIQSRQPSSVKVYDYYNPDQQCTQFYGTGANTGQNVDYECDKQQQACKCLQSLCVTPVEDEIRRLARKRKRPALKLYKYTCNSEKANYAVSVVIESVDYNFLTNQKTARGRVLKGIHQGIKNQEASDEMSFFWNLKCDHPDLEKGVKYIIIGKDGNLFKIGDKEEYRYPLMGTALVIRDRAGSKVLQRYKMLMNTMKGCNQ